MDKPKYVLVTYIRTTPEKLWQALTDPAFTLKYFFTTSIESTWKPGAKWKGVSGGKVVISGEVIEFDPPRKLVQTFVGDSKPEAYVGGASRLTYDIEPVGDSCKLTIIHEADKANPKMLDDVSNGWPLIIASLKSLLETGQPLEATNKVAGCGQR